MDINMFMPAIIVILACLLLLIALCNSVTIPLYTKMDIDIEPLHTTSHEE